MNTSRGQLSGAGLQTAALAFGGYTGGSTGATEQYNGTSWTSIASMITARDLLGGCGTQAAGLAFGGSPSVTTTEEFTNGPVVATKTVTGT
jgi:hypothetical protein